MPKPHTHGDRTVKNTAPEYAAWKSMRNRCENKNNPAYPRYGGRGITVCEQWSDYLTFLKDVGRKPLASHSLDRIDNNKGYEPSNCRWASRKEQNRNRRSNKVVEFLGRSQSVAGVPVAEAFTRPVVARKPKAKGGANMVSF
jgi:hypothetical protein